MILTPAESLKDTWAAIFRRRGRDGAYTRLFDNLDPSQRDTLVAALKLRESELPVIGSVKNSDNWLLLTTERLAWSIDGKCQELAAGAVHGAVIDFGRLHAYGSKLKMYELQVVTMGNRKYSIELEPGEPLSGVWNILMHLGRRNRNAASKALIGDHKVK